MYDCYLRVRLSRAEYTQLEIAADESGLTITEHVRCMIARDGQARNEDDFLAKITDRITAVISAEPRETLNANLEAMMAESVLLMRELVAERNAQVLGRVAQRVINLYPNRKII